MDMAGFAMPKSRTTARTQRLRSHNAYTRKLENTKKGYVVSSFRICIWIMLTGCSGKEDDIENHFYARENPAAMRCMLWLLEYFSNSNAHTSGCGSISENIRPAVMHNLLRSTCSWAGVHPRLRRSC